MLDHAMPKVSTLEYSSDVSRMNQMCMHIKMPLGPGCLADNLVDPYPRETGGSQWTKDLNWGEEYEEGELTWEQDVWPQIEDQTNIAVIAGLPMCKEREADIFPTDEQKHRYNRFVFLSPDYGVDKSGKVFMEEMNTNGFMIGDTYDEFYREQESTISALRMLGADAYPDSWKYNTRADTVIDAFCSQSKADCEMSRGRKELRALIDEELHSTRWERIFPPKENHFKNQDELQRFWDKYSGVLYKDPKEGSRRKQELMQPTELDLLTWEFIFWRQKNIADVKNMSNDEKAKLKDNHPLLFDINKLSKYSANDEKELLSRKHSKRLRPWMFET